MDQAKKNLGAGKPPRDAARSEPATYSDLWPESRIDFDRLRRFLIRQVAQTVVRELQQEQNHEQR